jgi:hypothetical protein
VGDVIDNVVIINGRFFGSFFKKEQKARIFLKKKQKPLFPSKSATRPTS